MDAAWLTAIGGIILGFLSFMVAVATWKSAATKQEMESLRLTIDHLQKENERLGNVNERLEKRLDDLEYENGALKEWAEALVCQVRGFGGTPVKFEEKTRPR